MDELIEECIRRGLPVTREDTIESIKLYLEMANRIDFEDKPPDQRLFEFPLNKPAKKANRSILAK
jgi:hypothetical protein